MGRGQGSGCPGPKAVLPSGGRVGAGQARFCPDSPSLPPPPVPSPVLLWASYSVSSQPRAPLSLQPSPPLQPDGNLPVRWGKRSDDTDEHPKLQCGLRGDHVPEPEQGGPGLPHQSACARPAVSRRSRSLPAAGPPHAAPAPAQGFACRQSVPQLLRGPIFPNIY